MKKGFTLVELLAVITVLAIILVIAIPNIQYLINENKKNTFLINAKSIIKQIKYEDKTFTTSTLSELNLEGITQDGYDAELSTAYISDEEIHLNLVGTGQYEGMYLCGVNLTTNKSEVQNTPCEELEKYIVTFDPNGGFVAISNKEVMYNATYGNLPAPKREGYKFLGWSPIPSDYQEVEYIESTGTQYIDSNYISNSKTTAILTYAITGPTSGGDEMFFGATNSVGSSYLEAYVNHRWYAALGGGRYRYVLTGKGVGTNKKYVAQINKDALVVDGNIKNSTEQISDANIPIYIFAWNNNGNVQYKHSHMRLYNLIFKENEEEVRNYIPCYHINSNETGLYDVINGNFYNNLGTDEFNKGNDGTYYYVTKDVKVTQRKNHTLKAIWEEI